MRVRVPSVVNLACAFALLAAVAVRAEDQAAPATPAPATPTPAEPVKAAAAPAPVTATDPAIKAIDAQIAKAALNKKDPAWRTKVPMFTAVKFDPKHSYLAHMNTN